ncbi:MAG: hypothetical protein WBP67_06525, partial [Thermoanaerobaculia bacterium]
SYLDKRSNRLWSFLIHKRLTHRAWRPLVELSRRRHLRFRQRLMSEAVPQRVNKTDLRAAATQSER